MASTGIPSTSSPPPGIEAAALSPSAKLEIWQHLQRNRMVDERLGLLYRTGKVVGGLFSSLGQEAISVGTAYALEEKDWVGPLIRNLGTLLVRGVRPREVFAQYLARATGPTGGRDGNTHFGDLDRRIVAPISHLGAVIPVMAGIALAGKMRGEDLAAMTYIGDGGTSTGDFHEGVNMAAVLEVPLVVIVENNGYAYSTPTSRQTKAAGFVVKAESYGIPGEMVDGNDVLAVYDATRRALAHARSGHGPVLLEMKTFRMKGHAEHDDAKYVPPELLVEWRVQDPLLRYDALLESEGILTSEERENRTAALREEIDADADFAVASPMPEASYAAGRVTADDGGIEGSEPCPR
ncbi:MAG: thiamine pyrophosphate-dependent dehydrogenase E1 component subunit alpha [Gemmatimonadota bacterium]|jgi:TPP-dependent pyruvate/acetoin dehydrogenase alpha subunit|nr:pyruvate dehydrogenase [Gemmatimonadota bacterium]MDP6461770.1 thiamine pyrophosphate-dependent dehydrogenase E1 component subunit alpha [Gemmatimonadota bacterium]MDP6529702.1 thiamine pyrophosphate-dependent dehydrogenase E1 component subunit alpha [Gemmatimonadota bacterium]MDP6802489.1 thiamine pyrophosphate-dependent dehydrogenase E1 component subunit alpha [Gemmatimonadota bacterium]MDP7030954.1 thiamine pyrophosphate-dependent dehydrogenase E1 component subunit alpha [Gemmatimonadota 